MAARARDDRALLVRYHRHGDLAARDELVERFLPLARRLAARYQRPGEPLDDLVQVASVGLVKAVEGFDPDRGTAFSSYAVPTILGELKRDFRDRGWLVHVPRDLQERVLRVDRAMTSLARELSRSPSVGEIGEAVGLSDEEVLEAMEAAEAYDAVSLEASREGEEAGGASVADTLGAEDPGYELVEYGATLEGTLGKLSERDRLVLHLRFVEDMTQSAIAERIGVSQMHVSRIIRRALAQLRAEVAPEE